MTGHIAALIEEWRTASTDPTRSQQSRERFRLRLVELEAARDADCAEWRERMLTCGEAGAERCGYEACIVSLGGKP